MLTAVRTVTCVAWQTSCMYCCLDWLCVSSLMPVIMMIIITGCAVAPALRQRRLALSMGNGNFRPSQTRQPSTDHQNICHRWLRRRPLRLCQIRCISVHGGLLGTWVKYNQNYFYLCLQVRHADRCSRMMAQTTRTRVRMCPFGDYFTLHPIYGVKTPNFGAWIGVFKPNSRNWKTCILSKLLHRFQPNLSQW